jgi:hypothetical protein
VELDLASNVFVHRRTARQWEVVVVAVLHAMAPAGRALSTRVNERT